MAAYVSPRSKVLKVVASRILAENSWIALSASEAQAAGLEHDKDNGLWVREKSSPDAKGYLKIVDRGLAVCELLAARLGEKVDLIMPSIKTGLLSPFTNDPIAEPYAYCFSPILGTDHSTLEKILLETARGCLLDAPTKEVIDVGLSLHLPFHCLLGNDDIHVSHFIIAHHAPSKTESFLYSIDHERLLIDDMNLDPVLFYQRFVGWYPYFTLHADAVCRTMENIARLTTSDLQEAVVDVCRLLSMTPAPGSLHSPSEVPAVVNDLAERIARMEPACNELFSHLDLSPKPLHANKPPAALTRT
ncbi:MAG: hypothetical protein PHY92_08050 [Alphaproteobacteria bacterium]|nr:hypothetical protein [Alphaproteobacteria bacterium]